MAGGTLFCCILAIIINLVQANYCDSDRCHEDEYCCGNNICCVSYKVWELWYFWFGLVFFMFLLSICACFWQYRRHPVAIQIGNSFPYSPLSTYPAEDMPSDVYRKEVFGHDSHCVPLDNPPSHDQRHSHHEAPPSYSEAIKSYAE
ncbi:hypothetical protein ScPMuIL_015289 [Solemya velum]